jgi:hypothetical protein
MHMRHIVIWGLSGCTIIIIIIIGTTTLSEPRPSLEASASRPYFLDSPAIAS